MVFNLKIPFIVFLFVILVFLVLSKSKVFNNNYGTLFRIKRFSIYLLFLMKTIELEIKLYAK